MVPTASGATVGSSPSAGHKALQSLAVPAGQQCSATSLPVGTGMLPGGCRVGSRQAITVVKAPYSLSPCSLSLEIRKVKDFSVVRGGEGTGGLITSIPRGLL